MTDAAPAAAPARGRWARWFVLVPFLHLAACMADLMSEQIAFTVIFCTISDDPLLSGAATGLVVALFLSLPFGFVAIRFRRLRPVYLVLLALIPVAMFGLDRLIAARIFTCDLP